MSKESFEENYKLLEDVSRELRENSISVDQLVPKMEQALKAVKVCKSVLKKSKIKLVEIEKEFNQIDESLEDLKS